MTARTDNDEVLTPGEVAKLFAVDPKTVTRWAHQGRLTSFLTPGGHRRFWKSEVHSYIEGQEGEKDS